MGRADRMRGLFLLLTFALTRAKFPTNPCWLEGDACLAGPDNLLATISGVADIVTCRQLCQDTEDCAFLTHFGPGIFSYSDHCQLFKSCDELHSCEDCRRVDHLGNEIQKHLYGKN